MDLKEAIAGSVEKWRALLAGEKELWAAFSQCSLCYYDNDTRGHDGEMCDACPLFLAGKGCCEDGSSFNSLQGLVDGSESEYDINHPEIRPHAEAMYKALLDIQEQHEKEQE